MRIQRILLVSFCALGVAAIVLAATFIIDTAAYSRKQKSEFQNPSRLIFGLRAYERDLNNRRQTWPATVSLTELVKGGFLSTNDVRAFDGMDVTLCLTIGDIHPQQLLLYVRLADGNFDALFGDGSVHQVTWQTIQDYLKAVPSDLRVMQGSWTGQELGGAGMIPLKVAGAGMISLKVEGAGVEFRGANTDEWLQAKFALREDVLPKQLDVTVTNCFLPSYIGKTAHAIYKLETNVLTVAINQPGDTNVPAAFNAPNSRKFVFKK